MQWLRMARDKVVSAHIEELQLQRINIPSEYIEEMASGAVAVSGTAGVDQGIAVTELALSANTEFLAIGGAKQITSAMIVDTTANTQVRVRAVDEHALTNLRAMEFTAPTTAHPVCYVREDYVYFEGAVVVSNEVARVYGVKAYTDSTVDVADMKFNGAHAGVIVEEATKIGMFELNPALYDTVNDGKVLTIKHTR